LEVANDAALGEDLKKWSQNHGIDSTTKWPQFEVSENSKFNFIGPNS